METNNQYRIVVHSFDKDEDRLFIKTLTEHYTQVHCVTRSEDITKILLEKLPTVVLVSSPNFQDTISVYYQSLGELKAEDCAEHFVVSLINRHDEQVPSANVNGPFCVLFWLLKKECRSQSDSAAKRF